MGQTEAASSMGQVFFLLFSDSNNGLVGRNKEEIRMQWFIEGRNKEETKKKNPGVCETLVRHPCLLLAPLYTPLPRNPLQYLLFYNDYISQTCSH